MERALVITSVASMVDQFFVPHILLLKEMGYETVVACNFENGSTCSRERIEDLKIRLEKWGIRYVHVDFARDITDLRSHLKAYRQIRRLLADQFALVHCHSPIGGLLTRLACIGARRKGTKVYYTAHGFHFFKGAPLKNWLIYYPVEKLCSYFTDVLITINKEDYALARKKMKAKRVEYVPGVGLDTQKFAAVSVDKAQKRKELGIPENAVLLLSVGELNVNKNHQVIIRALAKLNDTNIHYAIAGRGDQKDHLEALARELGVEQQVHLLGYRTDVAELCKIADIFCLPSQREGLGLASLEAMACALPLITSNVHGINDYSENNVSGYKSAPMDADGFAQAIRRLASAPEDRRKIGEGNREAVKKYDLQQIIPMMLRYYGIDQVEEAEYVSV